jgi:predicted RNase H-like HicB family nuclease
MKKEYIPHKMQLTAVYQSCEEGGYSAFVEEIPGVNTQGETLDEVKANLREALELVLSVRHEMAEAKIRDKTVQREFIPLGEFIPLAA